MTKFRETVNAAGRDPWIYLVLGALFGLMGVTDLLDDYPGDDFDGVTNLIGAVSMLAMFAASRLGVAWLKWVGWAAAAVFVALFVIELFGIGS